MPDFIATPKPKKPSLISRVFKGNVFRLNSVLPNINMRFLIDDSSSSTHEIFRNNEEDAINKDGDAGLFRSQLDQAEGYREIWKIVKETVRHVLGKSRVSMMLFLDDLPTNIGAYHSVGTNNIVLNKALVELVEATAKSKLEVNAFICTLLTHEYLHALGYLSENDVRHLVCKVSRVCFGKNHVATELAQNGPWALLNGVPINGLTVPKSPMEIVKDFESPNKDYIV